jgi:hypothetical protein
VREPRCFNCNTSFSKPAVETATSRAFEVTENWCYGGVARDTATVHLIESVMLAGSPEPLSPIIRTAHELSALSP